MATYRSNSRLISDSTQERSEARADHDLGERKWDCKIDVGSGTKGLGPIPQLRRYYYSLVASYIWKVGLTNVYVFLRKTDAYAVIFQHHDDTAVLRNSE